MNSNIKLIVTDMDGTLLGSNKLIPDENIQTIKMLQSKDIPVVLCTGRPHFMANEYIRQLNLNTQVIGSNGAVILDIKTNKAIFSSNMQTESLKAIGNFAFENNIDMLLYNENTVFFTENSKRIEIFHRYNEIATQGGTQRVPCAPIKGHLDAIFSGELSISKILITELNKGDLEKTRSLLKTLPSVYSVPSMDIVIDIMNAGVSKGNAVKTLAEHLSIPLENVLVIGDHQNDISMLTIAGFSACMANGHEEAKKYAQYITTKTSDNAGFTEAIMHFLELA